MAIKKAFIELHAMLAAAASDGKKVATILDDATELMSAKGAGGGASSVHRDDEGNVVGILDYYYKKWLPVEFVEFGAKANSTSGLNTMCKLGTSLWTKQQRDFKKAKEQLLEDVAAGDVQPTEIQAKLDQLEDERGFIADYPVAELTFDSIEELEAGLADPESLTDAIDAYNQEVADQAMAEEEETEEAA